MGDLQVFQVVKTVEGKPLIVSNVGKYGVFVGSDLKNLKQVTGADNLATNGVAHIIDGVMLPPTKLEAAGSGKPADVESQKCSGGSLAACIDLAVVFPSVCD